MTLKPHIQQQIDPLVDKYDESYGALGWSKLHSEDIHTDYEVEEHLRKIASEHNVPYSDVVSYYHKQVTQQSSGLLPF